MRKFGWGLIVVLSALLGCGGNVVIISDTISPSANQALDAGQSVTLKATVLNDPSNSGVVWSLNGAGTLSGQTSTTVVYTAPATITAASNASVVAVPVKNSLFAAATEILLGPALTINTKTLPAGIIGTPYSTQLGSTGGNAPITWTVTSGTLPAGLVLSSSGLISGTPTTPVNSTFTVTATDSATTPESASVTLSLGVTGAPLVITSTVPNGVTTKAYSDQLAVTGGVAPFTWSVASGTLPTGLTLTGGGLLSGTPSVAGIYSFTVKVVDTEPSPQSTTKSFTVTVYNILTITTATLPGGAVKNAYTATLQYSGGSGAITWTLASGSLPAGLTLNSTTGTISGTPSAAGTSSFVVQAVDNSSPKQTATASLSITVVLSTLAITTTSLPQGTTTTAYSATLQSSGGNPPVTWSLATGSNLPPGLMLSSAGVISGTPTTAGTYSFTVNATDSTPATVSQTLSITVVALATLTISTTTVPNGNIGTAYSTTLAATGGATPYTWSITAGSLPQGLALSTTGIISGTPLAAGTYTFTVQVKDSEATPATASRQFTLTIGTTLATGTGDARLTGDYGFLLNGFTVGNTAGKVYGFAAIGSLAFNGTGAVTGIEDINSASGVQTSLAVTGTYTVGSDGRGFMILTAGTATNVYAIATSNLAAGVAQFISLNEFDNSTASATSGNASGFARLQTIAAFATASVKGTFAFGFQGESPCSTCVTPAPKFGPIAAAGVFTADGVSAISAGQEDAAAYANNYTGLTFTGTFTTPSTTTGRGTFHLSNTGTFFAAPPVDYTYIIVNAGELLMLSNDTHATTSLLSGDVRLQQQTTYTAANLSGRSIGYESQGSGGDGATTYPASLNAILSALTITGSGTATLGQDADRAGTYANTAATAVTYTTAASGRTIVTTGGASNQVFYLYNTGAGFGLDQAATGAYPALLQYELQVASGGLPTLLSGTFAAETLPPPAPATTTSGNYVFSLHTGGVDGGISGTLATTLDTSSPAGALALGTTGSYLYAEDATGRNVVTTATGTTQSIVYAITTARAASVPVTASTPPTVTVLQQ